MAKRWLPQPPKTGGSATETHSLLHITTSEGIFLESGETVAGEVYEANKVRAKMKLAEKDFRQHKYWCFAKSSRTTEKGYDESKRAKLL